MRKPPNFTDKNTSSRRDRPRIPFGKPGAVPVISLYLLMSRPFIAGLTAGAVKG